MLAWVLNKSSITDLCTSWIDGLCFSLCGLCCSASCAHSSFNIFQTAADRESVDIRETAHASQPCAPLAGSSWKESPLGKCCIGLATRHGKTWEDQVSGQSPNQCCQAKSSSPAAKTFAFRTPQIGQHWHCFVERTCKSYSHGFGETTSENGLDWFRYVWQLLNGFNSIVYERNYDQSDQITQRFSHLESCRVALGFAGPTVWDTWVGFGSTKTDLLRLLRFGTPAAAGFKGL